MWCGPRMSAADWFNPCPCECFADWARPIRAIGAWEFPTCLVECSLQLMAGRHCRTCAGQSDGLQGCGPHLPAWRLCSSLWPEPHPWGTATWVHPRMHSRLAPRPAPLPAFNVLASSYLIAPRRTTLQPMLEISAPTSGRPSPSSHASSDGNTPHSEATAARLSADP